MISIKELLGGKSAELFAVASTALVSEALQMLATRKIGALLVVDDGRLVGILSERDCALKVALPGRRADATRVSEIMTSDVITVEPKQPLEDCMTQMHAHDIRHLPVVEAGRPVGMVSIGDVSREMFSLQKKLIGQLEAYIHGRSST
jgi:CBS domain-containing protein